MAAKKSKPAAARSSSPKGDSAPMDANAVRPSRDLTAPEGFAWLTIAQIAPDPNNARKVFDDESLGELADSMAAKGLLQKPAVRPANDAGVHQLVAGERRWRAWSLLVDRGDWPADHVELCPIIEGDDAFTEEAGLIENLQRKDLKPLEEARGFQRLKEVHGHDNASIAEKVGFTVRFVQQRLQLLQLKAGDMLALEKGAITIEEARRRVAAYPAPLSPNAKLALAELVDANPTLEQNAPIYVGAKFVERSNDWRTWIEAQVDDKAFKELRERWFIQGPNTETVAGVDTGRARVSWSWNAKQNVKDELPGVTDGRKRAELIAQLRNEAERPDPSDTGPWTPWLRPATELSPELQATIDAAKVRAIQQETNAKAQRDAEAAKRAAVESAKVEARQRALSLASGELAGGEVHEPATMAAVLKAGGHPIPWRWDIDDDGAGCLLDADGDEVLDYGFDRELLGPLMMAAMNRACGHEAVIVRPVSLERPSFEAAMIEALCQQYDEEAREEIAERVPKMLDAYLLKREIAFGAEGNLWTANAAGDLADDLNDEWIRSSAIADDTFTDVDADLVEPADDEDADLPGTLTRLAGVGETETMEA